MVKATVLWHNQHSETNRRVVPQIGRPGRFVAPLAVPLLVSTLEGMDLTPQRASAQSYRTLASAGLWTFPGEGVAGSAARTPHQQHSMRARISHDGSCGASIQAASAWFVTKPWSSSARPPGPDSTPSTGALSVLLIGLHLRRWAFRGEEVPVRPSILQRVAE
jgi:hypothetical protein